jgi:hypothetical protein
MHTSHAILRQRPHLLLLLLLLRDASLSRPRSRSLLSRPLPLLRSAAQRAAFTTCVADGRTEAALLGCANGPFPAVAASASPAGRSTAQHNERYHMHLHSTSDAQDNERRLPTAQPRDRSITASLLLQRWQQPCTCCRGPCRACATQHNTGHYYMRSRW